MRKPKKKPMNGTWAVRATMTAEKHDQEEATASQSDVDDAFFVFAKIPVVGTESTEENTKKTSGDGRFDAGRDGVLESWVPLLVG